ncbi:molybdopterin cofactor-binding domain-containing protein [Dermatophilaceae bacterium Soc4.6]
MSTDTSTDATTDAPTRPLDGGALSRRGFLTAVGVAGGFAVGFATPAAAADRRAVVTASAPARASVNAVTSLTPVTTWVRIGADESVTILVGAAEMGQGVHTSLAQLVAEDLMVDWTSVRAEAAPADRAYANPATGSQLTGGSMSIRGYHSALRLAGAAARDMLRAAAAARFGVDISRCVASGGVVSVTGTSSSATYGQLAAAAATQPVPQDPALTPDDALRIVGHPVPRVDIPDKVRGAAVYGIDVRVPGMLHATVRHSPMVGGTVRSTGPTPARALAVVDAGDAVVVVARTTWDAMVAARSLKATWNAPATTTSSTSSTIAAQAATLMATGTAQVADTAGSVGDALGRATRHVDATYDLPYLAHAAMEPLACTASVTASGCELWAPTQAPGLAAAAAAAICGLTPDRVIVHSTMLGGGLGRKFETDFIAHAVRASRAVGAPVKVTWSREEDFTHDQYRPMAQIRVRAGADATGAPTAVWTRVVSPSILGQRGWLPAGAVDSQAVDGAVDLPYAVPSRLVEYVRHQAAVPVGFWRSVGNSLNCFAVESALDELALSTGRDPVELRLSLLEAQPRVAAVLRTVADASGWGTSSPTGTARGVALTHSFGTIVAQVAEVTQPSPGRIAVTRVWCAVDCGQVVNPDTVRAQMEGGIVHGLSAALWGRITFDKGVASPRNFDGYKMVRMRDMPRVAVTIVPSTEPPGGVGEPGVPAVAPAVANAWASLTGTRVRRLPLQ